MTDFGNWTVPTWECYGDKHGNTCEPHWKSPEYPDPLYTIGSKESLIEVIWPRILFLIIVLFLVDALVARWPPFWTFLLGVSVRLLIIHFADYL